MHDSYRWARYSRVARVARARAIVHAARGGHVARLDDARRESRRAATSLAGERRLYAD